MRELRSITDAPLARPAIIIDQTEESFVLPKEEEVKVFSYLLANARKSGWVILAALRSVFLVHWQRHNVLGRLAENNSFYSLPILMSTEIPKVIEGPAKEWYIDSELVVKLIEDTIRGDALPILAFGLRELWERRSLENRISEDTYRAFGGLDGVVRVAADIALPDITESDQELLRGGNDSSPCAG